MHPNQTRHYVRTMRRYVRRNPGARLEITRSNGEKAGTLFQEPTGRLAFASAQAGARGTSKGLAIILGLVLARFFDDPALMLRMVRDMRPGAPSRLPG